MAEYWKSTPKYWCKFCEIYVRDTPIERKNHESSAKHQNSIQRSLRELHKGQAKVQRDQDKAKDEVARLNKLVGSKATSSARPADMTIKAKAVASPSSVDFATSHRAQMKQLAAMGIHVPSVDQEAIAVGGGWQAVPESFVDVPVDEQATVSEDARIKGIHKRKPDNDDEITDQPHAKRSYWGSSLKTYPGKATEDDPSDLDALLSGVTKKQDKAITQTTTDDAAESTDIKTEEPVLTESAERLQLKQEDGDSTVTAPPVIAFKKRKSKR